MEYETIGLIISILLLVILLLIAIIIINLYWIKRIKRRVLIKKMKVDDNINHFIDDFKRNIINISEIKKIQRKTRNNKIFEIMLFLMIIISLHCPLVYIFYELLIKDNIPEAYIIYKLYMICIGLFIIELIVFFIIKVLFINKYEENKIMLKKYILDEFFKKLTYDIKWYDDKPDVTKETLKMWDTYINWNKLYKKAGFNRIEDDEEKETNILFKRIYPPENVQFEDYLRGIYKEKYIVSFSDFKKVVRGRRGTTILSEGIFCVVKIDKSIDNTIIITNNKRSVTFLKKSYMVKDMPQDFYKNFIILAKDRYKIEEKISAKAIEMIKEFYDNSRIKFDISIKEDEIFFRFNTIDTMEIRRIGNIVDDLMLKEYANIIMFVTKVSEEINDNWKN